jgi:ribonuclease G
MMAAMREGALPYAEHMARNTLVINCDIRETRVCLIESGVIAELHLERAAVRGTVGNIILGRVTRVLPGMQAAFIDIGMERAAFLHVEDLIRPDDFEAYLDKDGLRDVDPVNRGALAASAKPDAESADDDDEGPQESLPVSDSDDAAELDSEDFVEVPEPSQIVATEPGEFAQDTAADEGTTEGLPAGDLDSDPDDQSDGLATDGNGSGEDAGVSDADGPEDADEDASEQVAQPEPRVAAAPNPLEQRNGRRRRRGRNNGRGRDRREPVRVQPSSAGPARVLGRDRRNRGPASRGTRAVPITEVVKEGDEVIVQVSKEPIGTKGARVTSHVALPGRHVVYLPTVDHIGISKRIGSTRERQRLRQVMESLKPEAGGLIVRTVAEGLTKKDLKTDIGYLIALWKEVSRLKQGARSPATLYTELDLVLKTARDLFTDDVERIIIDDREQHARLVRFVEMFLPSRVQDIELYNGDEPIFDAYGIEDEIGRALGRKVPLASGGYLVIDQAEALTAIDVNTGRYVGKGSKDLEETALKTNLEAVAEIAYQLRLRNIGGLVILDLIDMDQSSNREAVWRALEQALAKDKAKTTINRISELGLIEMTRKRTRESLTRMLHEPCFYCDGTGQIQSRTTVAYEILRQIRRERHNLKGYSVVVNAHPAVVDLLQTEEKLSVQEAERRYLRRIELVARREYHLEQFDLQGK